MTGTILLLALLLGGIAIWAVINLMRDDSKAAAQRRARAVTPMQTPADPWGPGGLRRGERDSLPPGKHSF